MYFSCASRLARQTVLTGNSWILFGLGCSSRSRVQREHHRLAGEDCKSFSWNGGSLNPMDLNALRDVAELHGQADVVSHKKICSKEAWHMCIFVYMGKCVASGSFQVSVLRGPRVSSWVYVNCWLLGAVFAVMQALNWSMAVKMVVPLNYMSQLSLLEMPVS